jgi:diguanylate cyclase (GGDEF)-like protein
MPDSSRATIEPASRATLAVPNIRNLHRALLGLAIVIPALYIYFAYEFIAQDYRATMARTASDVANISTILVEHAVRTIGEADSRLQGAIGDIEERGLTLSAKDDPMVNAILVRQVSNLPQARGLSAVDAQGWVRVSSMAYPFNPIDGRDREYYRFHVEHPGNAPHLSKPIRSRYNGKWTIPLSRRIDHPDGSLKAIIVLSIDLEYFNAFYRTLRVGEHGTLTLARPDGWVLMETPMDERILSLNFSDAPLFRHARLAGSGTYEVERSTLDDSARIVGFARATRFPMIAAVSMSRDYVLKPWRDRIRDITLMRLFSILLLESLIVLLWRRLHELMATQDDLARRNAALAHSRQRYEELVDGIDGIVWEATLPDMRFTYVSGNAGAISGYPARQWLSDPQFWLEKLGGGTSTPLPAFAPDGRTTALQPIEHHVVTPDGRERWLRSNVMVTATGRNALQLRGVTVDVTDLRLSEQRLFEVTHFDPLTKLPNRFTLLGRIEHAIALAARNKAWVAVILIDLDQFKTINDSLGHEKGDQIICTVGKRIQDALRRSDFLARLGGDEFVVLMEDFGDSVVGVEQLVERISRSFDEPIALDGRDLYVGISMGISLFPEDASDSKSLRRHADTALYRAKAAGRNCWRFFDESMAHQARRRLEIETAMRRATERHEFQLYYQPQQSLRTGQITGVETLLRWPREGGETFAPPEFLPLAEESGQIIPLGTWVLQSACAEAAAWDKEHGMLLRLAVNIAAKQIHHADFVAQVQRILDTTGLPPHRLELELTESSIIAGVDDTVCKLQQLKALGVEIAIDDFGTGYSSLSYLKDFPIDRLKIDQSFIRDLPRNRENRAIVRTVIAMAKNLGLGVIAEGVETQAQLEFLRAEGCDEIQGYLLSRPIPAQELIDRYARRAPQTAPLSTK